MRKWHADLARMEELGEQVILDTVAQGMYRSDVLGALGVNGKAYEEWVKAQPHRRSKIAAIKMKRLWGSDYGRTEEAAR